MKTNLFLLSYLLLILVMFLLPRFSAEGYSILKNTTSQLGAQKTQNAWVMNATFVLMGITSIFAGWAHYEGHWLHRVLLLLFGCSFMLVAVFHHAPITPGVTYSIKDDQLHSLFASTTGFSFIALAIATAFLKETKSEMILPIAMGVIATILSLLMFTVENLMGIWQRLMFMLAFGWMIYEFRN